MTHSSLNQKYLWNIIWNNFSFRVALRAHESQVLFHFLAFCFYFCSYLFFSFGLYSIYYFILIFSYIICILFRVLLTLRVSFVLINHFTNFLFRHEWNGAWLFVIKMVYKCCIPRCQTIVKNLQFDFKFHCRQGPTRIQSNIYDGAFRKNS